MKQIISLLVTGLVIGGCTESANFDEANQLSAAEQADGWRLLFDGESTAGWKGFQRDDVPGSWEVVDGSLFLNSVGADRDPGDILYAEQFEDFHLKLEWKISEGGNSGIFYRGSEAPELDVIYKSAPEMQVLDNDRHPDAKMGVDGNRTAGALYDLIPPRPPSVRPVGEWNLAEIRVEDGNVQHFLNGEQVLEYQLGTEEWRELVAGSKFPELNPDWAEVPTRGYIALQDHNDAVWYRNIRIKEL